MKIGSMELGKLDSILAGWSALFLIVSIYCFFFDNTIFGLLSLQKVKQSQEPIIGKITDLSNDAKHLEHGTLGWQQAHKDQNIRQGDSLFTGENSMSQLALNEGGSIHMDQNTLISFTKIRRETLLNLVQGNFNVQVKGELKIAIAGEVTSIKGDQSEVQIVIDKKQKKPQVKLIKGNVRIQQAKSTKVVSLKKENFTELQAPVKSIEPEVQESPVIPETPHVFAENDKADDLYYIDQLYDLYEQQGDHLMYRKNRPALVSVEKKIAWTSTGNVPMVFGHLAKDTQFERSTIKFQGADRPLVLNKVYLGDNYWQISHNELEWTKVQKFTVRAMPLLSEPPQIRFIENKFIILEDQLKVEGQIDTAAEFKNYVVEISRTADFNEQYTKIKWVAKKNLSMNVKAPGSYFFRLRGVDEKLQVTRLSAVTQIHFEKPDLPSDPEMSEQKLTIIEKNRLPIRWSKSSNASQYHVSILNSQGKVVESKNVSRNSYYWEAENPGQYQAQVTALDQWGRHSLKSSKAKIDVLPTPVVPKLAEKAQEPQRKPSEEASSYSKLELKTMIGNENYKSSQLQVEGAMMTYYGQDPNSAPNIATMAIRDTTWWGSHGVEAFAQTKLANVGSAQTTSTPTHLEARYHYRWLLPWNWLISSGGSQVSAIAGYEHSVNSSTDYSPAYDIVKTGMSLKLPLFNRWATGGEALIGMGTDTSKKYEASWHVDYFLEKEWSLGAGYRIQLFEAGSTKTAPASIGLPYREGATEAYSTLKYTY